MLQEFKSLNFIDIHYHADPDLYKRIHNSAETAKLYKTLKGAVVLKSHLGSTSIQATLLQQEGFLVFPSLVLNKISGGINYRTVIKVLAEYMPVIPTKLIVHFPTITGRKHQSKLRRELLYPELNTTTLEPETIFNSSEILRSEVIDILKMSKDYPIVLSTGHASKKEVYSLIDACEELNVSTLLLNQPANPLTGFNAEELIKLARQYPFLRIEQTALTYMLTYQDKQDFINVLSNVPNVIYSSDLGQSSQIDIEEWLSFSNQWFSEFKISTEKRREICLTNPLQLLKM